MHDDNGQNGQDDPVRSQRGTQAGQDQSQSPIPDQSPHTRFPTTEDATQNSPHNLGEQDAMGGTTPHPETDDDVDQMSERTIGNSPEPGEEIPNLADEINKDEQAIRES